MIVRVLVLAVRAEARFLAGAPRPAEPAATVSGDFGGSGEPYSLPAGSWTIAAWLAARSAKSLSRSPSTWCAGT
uniref:Uncharacterized protein n=1 Tax=Streptomyces avermitilis TaxID=33903 RepID=A0A499VQW6_STRAX|nr:hypothetical protein SAVMC3_14060 [Streptomyces avermitilis]